MTHTQTTYTNHIALHVLLRLEPWPQCSKNQLRSSNNKHSFSNYVRIRDVVQKICLRRWTIRKSGKRGSGISVLPAQHDDDDEGVWQYRFLWLSLNMNSYQLSLLASTLDRIQNLYMLHILVSVVFKNRMFSCVLRKTKDSENTTWIAWEELCRWGAGRKNVWADEKYIMTEVFNFTGLSEWEQVAPGL